MRASATHSIKIRVIDAAGYPLSLQSACWLVRMLGIRQRKLQSREKILDPVVGSQRLIETSRRLQYGLADGGENLRFISTYLAILIHLADRSLMNKSS